MFRSLRYAPLLVIFSILVDLQPVSSQTTPVNPPGTIKISRNLYVDQTEITNRMYLQLLTYNAYVYGRKSPEYQQALPDTTVWKKLGKGYQHFTTEYLRHPKYQNYPVVGISYKQAKKFSKWRSNRAMEVMLVKKQLIPNRLDNPQKDSLFTIEKYFTGNYYHITPNKTIPYPQYELLSPSTYQFAAKIADSINRAHLAIDPSGILYKRLAARTNCLQNLSGKTAALPYGPLPINEVVHQYTRLLLLTDISTNVREITAEKGVYFGNSYRIPCQSSGALIRKSQNATNAYTGFRNQCQYKLWSQSSDPS